MARYEQFHQIHEDWNVGAYTFGHIMKNNFYMRWNNKMMLNMMIGSSIERKAQYPEYSELYNHKIRFNYNRMARGAAKGGLLGANGVANDKAVELIKLVDGWLS